MLCNDIQDLLAAYLDGGIDDPTTQAEIARHLEGCADCRTERDALVVVLAQVAPVIKAAGDSIPMPDAKPVRAHASQPIRRPVLRLPFNSNHKNRDNPMTNTQKPPVQRRISALNGVMTFALSLVLLIFVWLVFNGAIQRGPASGETPEPSQEAEQPRPLIQFGNPPMVTLTGYEVKLNGAPYSLDANPALYPGDQLTVSFDLDSIEATGNGLAIFAYLADGNGQVVAQNDVWLDTDPFSGRAENTLTISAETPIGTYQLFAGLSQIIDGSRMPILLDGQLAEGDALPLQDYVAVAAAELPTATPPAAPTIDPLGASGGFRENAVDVSTLPEYTLPNNGGGGGGGGGGGCPEVDPQIGVAVGAFGDNWLNACIYGIPDVTPGAEFRVTLVSPSGKSYIANYVVANDGQGNVTANRVTDEDQTETIYIYPMNERNTASIPLYFPAAQEYGEWLVKGTTLATGDFAIGSVTVAVSTPIYSVTHADDPLDPFTLPLQQPFNTGDTVIFAARGLEAGRRMVLALYREDETRRTDTHYVMIPVYATQITVADDGSYKVEFVVGTDTPLTYFTGVYDPDPTEYLPAPFGMQVIE